MRLFRLVKIVSVSLKYGLHQMILSSEPTGRLAWLARALRFGRRFDEPSGARLRQALEPLGPIMAYGARDDRFTPLTVPKSARIAPGISAIGRHR